MRHPAAPSVIAFLLGLLAFLLLWGKIRGDGHHEGNPHPDDVPPLKVEEEEHGAAADARDKEGEES